MMHPGFYLGAYTLPFCALIGILLPAPAAWLTPIVAFLIIPVLDFVYSGKQADSVKHSARAQDNIPPIYDYLLYCNVLWITALICLSALSWNKQNSISLNTLAQVLSLGIVLGANGINVAHELGHRAKRLQQNLAALLLLPSFYMHFTIEHNRGHHKFVSTPDDPSSARKNESLYRFWIRSVCGVYQHAWRIQQDLLAEQAFISRNNRMIWFTLIEIAYIALLFILLTPQAALLLISAGVLGFLMLESINYIEHYGLERELLENGKYERVQPHHSWNANFPIGRIALYELTRHSDHHFLARKQYPELQNLSNTPELPCGYPAAVLLATIPPLWFKVMNKRLERS